MISVHCWQMLEMKFLSFNVDHWCERPAHFVKMGVSPELWRNISAPFKNPETAEGPFDQCRIFDIDYNSTGMLVYTSKC